MFCDMMPCIVGEIHHCFHRTCCLHVQGSSSTLFLPLLSTGLLRIPSQSTLSLYQQVISISLTVLPPNTDNFKKIPANVVHYSVKFLQLKHYITPTCFNPIGSSSGMYINICIKCRYIKLKLY